MARWIPLPRPCTSLSSDNPAACASLTYSSTTEGMSRGANGCRSSSGSIGMRTGASSSGGLGGRIVDGSDRGRDPATDGEVAGHGHPLRPARIDEVIEDLIGDRLVEDSLVAELHHVILQSLQFQAQRVGDVVDLDLAEVGEP